MAYAQQVNVQDEDAVVGTRRRRVVISKCLSPAFPIFSILGWRMLLFRARVSMCDFGGDTAQVRQQLAFDVDAKAADITMIPDCGQVPGLGTSLCAYAMTLLDEPRDIIMYDGDIPHIPIALELYPDLQYLGLTVEYFVRLSFYATGNQGIYPALRSTNGNISYADR